MNTVWVVFKKEIVDSMRDYRSWATGLFWALFGPLLMGGLFMMIGSNARESIEKPLHLSVQNPQHAPSLIHFLEQNDVIIEAAPNDPEAAVKAGDVNLVLIIPDEFPEDFSSGDTATVQMVMDSSRQSINVDITRLGNLLENYSRITGALRLIVRGISPEVIQPVFVEEVDVASPQSRATFLVSFLPYFIIFAMFNGAAPIITDTTAGERERQSLEPLLINPVPRHNFVLGKLLAAFPFSLASLAITLIGFGVVFNILPVDEFLGTRIALNVFTLFMIFLICLPIALLASAIQMVVASFAKSTKEAGTYLPFIALIPSLPGMVLAFFPVKPALWMMLIPTFGQQLLINQLMRLEPMDTMNVVTSTVMTLLLSAGLSLIAILLYKRERIIVRKS